MLIHTTAMMMIMSSHDFYFLYLPAHPTSPHCGPYRRPKGWNSTSGTTGSSIGRKIGK